MKALGKKEKTQFADKFSAVWLSFGGEYERQGKVCHGSVVPNEPPVTTGTIGTKQMHEKRGGKRGNRKKMTSGVVRKLKKAQKEGGD